MTAALAVDTSGAPGALNPVSAAGEPGVDRHLDLLSLLMIISGGLAGLTAASLLALGIGAAMLLASPQSSSVATVVAVTTFVALALMLLAYAAASVSAGRGLRRREHWSRLVALVLSLLNLLIVPFGTALAVYALWVLLRQRSRELLGVQ